MKKQNRQFSKDPRNAPNINYIWSKFMVEELVRCGADHFWIAPGSRSAPLAVAANDHPAANCTVHFDERGLAFHALGFSSATRKPVVVICTSGTAVANLYPAVIECAKKKLPMIVLTADRPPELRHAGSHQTIDQVKIFEGYVHWQVDLPCPCEEIHPSMLLTTIDQAVAAACGYPGGPVHLNCMFREPLAPVKQPVLRPGPSQLLDKWFSSNRPYTIYSSCHHIPAEQKISDAAGLIDKSKHGIIAVGKLSTPEDCREVLALSMHLGWPVFADLSSGLRLGHGADNRIRYFDRILATTLASKIIRPGCILHIGGRITSKHWYQFVDELQPESYIMVLNHPLRSDPFHRVTFRIQGAPHEVCNALRLVTAARKPDISLSMLKKCDETVHSCIEKYCAGHTDISEITTARAITRLIPQNSTLFTANSLSIRLLEFYGDPSGNPVHFGANRGASGIDGTIATAAGFAKGHNKPLTLLCGDQAMLHDLNSLSLCSNSGVPMVIVVLNNGGGGIFSLLPIASLKNGFDKIFAAQHDFSFRYAARMFSLHYKNTTTTTMFTKEYARAVKTTGTTIIEIRTKRKDTAQEIEQITAKITNAIKEIISIEAQSAKRKDKY